MPLVAVVVTLIVVGVLLWLVNTYLAPYIWPPMIKVINIVSIVAVILWLLNLFFNLSSLWNVRIGH